MKATKNPVHAIGRTYEEQYSTKDDFSFAIVLSFNSDTDEYKYVAFWIDDNAYGEPEIYCEILREDYLVFLQRYSFIKKSKVVNAVEEAYKQLEKNHNRVKCKIQFGLSALVKAYPTCVCADCGKKYGKASDGAVSTYHTPENGEYCGWCGSTENGVTHPRNYGFPPALGR